MGHTQAQQYPHAIRRGFIPLLLVSSAALLSACGGGGGGGTPVGDVQTTPQSVTGPYTVVETSQSIGGTVSHKVNVVDVRTGTLAVSYETAGIGTDDRHRSVDWHTVGQHVRDADGLGYSQTGSSQLAVIQNGKVMLLDLSGSTIGTARQISKLSNACAIEDRDAVLSADGRHAWLRVTTSGTGTCTAPVAATHVLVSTDMAATDEPVASGTSSGASTAKDIVLVLRDTAGTAQGLLVVERSLGSNKLSVYSNDLKTTLTSAGLPSVQADAAARTLALSPSDPRQALVQIGASLYLADWRSGSLTLGNALGATLTANTASTSDEPVVTRNSTTFYVADGNKLLAIGTSGSPVSTATLDATRGTIVDAAATTNSIVVSQNNATATSGFASTLWSIGKAAFTQTPQEIAKSTSKLPYRVAAISGDTVIYSQQSGAGEPRWHTLQRANVESSAGTSIPPQTVATDVGLIAHVRNPHVRVGVDAVQKLLWCKPDNLTQGCTGTLVSYDVASAQPVTIGNVLASGEAPPYATDLFSFNDAWSGRNMAFVLKRVALEGSYSDALFLVNPSTAGSLQAVSSQP